MTWPFQLYLQHCPGREIPPYGENIISFPACLQMFIIFLFSLHEGFQRDTSSFGKSAVTQNLLVLSPMQVKQPKKHDNYHKLMPYTSSPIPCVYVVNLKCRLLTVGTSSCYAFVPRLREQDAAGILSHLARDGLTWLLPHTWSSIFCFRRAVLQLPTCPISTHEPRYPDTAVIYQHFGIQVEGGSATSTSWMKHMQRETWHPFFQDLLSAAHCWYLAGAHTQTSARAENPLSASEAL